MNVAAFLSIHMLGTFPLDYVPPTMKNLFTSVELIRFFILESEIAYGLAEYFSGLKYTKIPLAFDYSFMLF